MKNAVAITLASAALGVAGLGIGYWAGQDHTPPVVPIEYPAPVVEIPQQKIESIVREYLLANPELMVEVQSALEAKQAQAQQAQIKQIIARNKDSLLNSGHDAVFGNPKGDVTVVEFFDYNCGYCKHALPDMQAILKNDPNVRFVMKEFPILGPDSTRAHLVAQAFKALYPDKYLQYHQILLGAQTKATEDSAIIDAVRLGADENLLREKMKDPALTTAFQEVYQLAGQLNITGTPSYVIGNELVPGAIGMEGLLERIAAARAAK